jgi:hypothetical protein
MSSINDHYNKYVNDYGLVCVPITHIGYSEKTKKKETIFAKEWNKYTLDKSKSNINSGLKLKGVSMLTGEINNVIVLDIDNVESANEFLNNIGMTVDDLLQLNTPICKTRKGYHIYFKYYKKLNKSVIELKVDNKTYKVDLLSNGKLVILPPTSYEINGKPFVYEWIKSIDTYSPIDIPKNLRKFIVNCQPKIVTKSPRHFVGETFEEIIKNSPINLQLPKIPQSKDTEIENIVMNLNTARAEDYTMWLNLCICLKNIGYLEDNPNKYWSILDKFSKKCPKKYDYDNNRDKYWDNIKVGQHDQPLSYGSLWGWLKEDNPDVFKELCVSTKNIPEFEFDSILQNILESEFYITDINNIRMKSKGYKFNANPNSRCLCEQTSDYFELYTMNSDINGVKNIILRCNYCSGRLILFYLDHKLCEELGNVINYNIIYAFKFKNKLYLKTVTSNVTINMSNLEIITNDNVDYIHNLCPLKLHTNLGNIFQNINELINDWELSRPDSDTILITSNTEFKPQLSIQYPDDSKRVKLWGEFTDAKGKTKKVFIKKKDTNFVLDSVNDTIMKFWTNEVKFPTEVLDFNVKSSYDADKLTDLGIVEKMDSLELLDNIIITPGDDLYWFNMNSKTWILTNKDKIGNPLIKRFKEKCKDELSDADIKYIESSAGASNIMRKLVSDIDRIIIDSRKIKLFDNNPYLIPFDNCVYDLALDCVRNITKYDYITETTGYSLRPRDQIQQEDFDFINDVYRKILPDPDDREFFLRLVGSCIPKLSNEKIFVILTDLAKGYNGKSTIMKAVMYVFGELGKKGDASLIYESNMQESINAHSQGYLSYKNKRLIYIDETSQNKRLAVGRIKNLTSGSDNQFSARRIHSAVVEVFEWTGTIFTACNSGDFSTFKTTDSAFLSRLRVIPFKSEFVSNIAEDDYENNVFRIDNSVTEKLRRYREAHFYMILDAYKRYKQHGLAAETESSKLYKNALMCTGDSLYGAVNEYLDSFTRFVEGSFVTRKELVNNFMTKYEQFSREKETNIQDSIEKYMQFKGVTFHKVFKAGGRKKKHVYENIELLMIKREDLDEE